jgi:hypothetical protein
MQAEQFRLTPELRTIALGALEAYLQAPPGSDGRTPVEANEDLDRKRVEVIENTLKRVLFGYLENSVSLFEFKRQVDSINKQSFFWGFRGIKGQMFFNMLVKATEGTSVCDSQLRAAIREPENEEEAATLLRNFGDYVVSVGQQVIDAGGGPHNRPKQGSIPFFVSYFWQIQRLDVWPVYYTSTVQAIEGMNLWQTTAELGDDYLTYKQLHEILTVIFSEHAGRSFNLYNVEHAFWFKNHQPPDVTAAPPAIISESNAAPPLLVSTKPARTEPQQASVPPDIYVPPIVAVIPKLALNDPELQEKARQAGTSVERALEKSINAAFTVLGYETRLLGQGGGRVPDGQAIAVNDQYAILWDAKARAEGYRMGTDDRTIRQYIDTQSRGLKRGRGIRNIYYLIISSSFSDDFDDLRSILKMETDVNEVCLVEAAALVAIVNQYLRAPLAVSRGSDGIQRLFSSGGRITEDDVLENLVG